MTPAPVNAPAPKTLAASLRGVLGLDRALAGSARQLNRNLLPLILGNGVALALSLATTTYLARRLGQAGFGVFSFAQSIATYAALVLDLGLTTYGNRAVARDPQLAPDLIADIQAVRCVVAGTVAMLALVALSGMAGRIGPGPWQVVLISLLWVLPFEGAPEWFFLGSQRMSTVSAGKVTLFGAVLIFTVMTVRGPEGVEAAALARVMGGVVWAACLLALVPRGLLTLKNFSLLRAFGRVKEAFPFLWLAVVTQVFAGVDVVLLGMWRPPEEVGIYSAAFRLVAFLLLGISLINTAVFPMVAAASQHGASRFVAIARLYRLVAVVIALCLVLVGIPLAPMLLKLAYGDSFSAAVPLMRWLIVGTAVQTLNGALAQPLLAAGREAAVTHQSTGTAVIFLGLNAIAIPRFGAAGAAAVYTISVFVGTVWLVPAYLKLLRFQSASGGGTVG